MPFGGKIFSTSEFVSGARMCNTETANGLCHALPVGDPRPDLGASAWALEVWGEVVHRDLVQHDVPLWNPYQGIGTPLAANMQSAVFDPLLLLWHLHPTPLTQDLSFLLGLVLIGAAAYFAARMMRLGVVARCWWGACSRCRAGSSRTRTTTGSGSTSTSPCSSDWRSGSSDRIDGSRRVVRHSPSPG